MKKNKNFKHLFLGKYLLLFLAMIVLNACSNPNAIENKSANSAEAYAIEESISISPSQFESNKMTLVKIEKRPFYKSIKTNGVFDVPPKNKVTISVYYGGFVRNINLLPGEKIKKGDKLFTLENPEFIKIQQSFLEIKNQIDFLRSDYERQKSLRVDKVNSQKEYFKAESEYKVSQARLASLKTQLRLMNINPDKLDEENISSKISIFSPTTGFISSISINEGMYLNSSDEALTIINPDHMHLELIVFEQDLMMVAPGQKIRFKIQEHEDKVYEGEVHLVNHSVDPVKRTASIHGHIDNEKENSHFNPGMYVEAEILTTPDSIQALPESSIVRIDDKKMVLFQNKKGNEKGFDFEKRIVETGQIYQGYVEILNYRDFPENAKFLGDGAFEMFIE